MWWRRTALQALRRAALQAPPCASSTGAAWPHTSCRELCVAALPGPRSRSPASPALPRTQAARADADSRFCTVNTIPAQCGTGRAYGTKVVTEDLATDLLTHYCKGLREVLTKYDVPFEEDTVLPAIREINTNAQWPEELPRFWSSLYLGVAFQYEIEFAIPQSRDAAQSLLNLAMRCADAGLLQYFTPFTLHRQLAAAGADLTGPPCAAPALAADVTPWTLFAACDEKLGKDVWAQLAKDGFAVIPSFLGACQAGEVASQFEEYIKAHGDEFEKGELDETGRSNDGVRGDRIRWLVGSELQQPCVGGLAQLLRTRLLEVVTEARDVELESRASGAAIPQQDAWSFVPPSQFMGKAMLSVYPPGSVGFATHTDTAATDDLRKLSVVYYLNKDWEEGYGGELVLNPGHAGNEARIMPAMDQLVMFWSDRINHTVRPTDPAAPPRKALSFWYLQDPSSLSPPPPPSSEAP